MRVAFARFGLPLVALVAGCSFLADEDDYSFGGADGGIDGGVEDGARPDVPAAECQEDVDCARRPNAEVTCREGRCVDLGCAEGFDDCDGVDANGCEASTASDVANCGRCGNACLYPQAMGICADGVCELGACRDGFDNCDGNVDNGCEADLRSAGACGACGVSCVAPTPLCDSSGGAARCVERCTGDATLCGTECVDADADARHCGACDRACSEGPRGMAVCASATCGFECDAGFGDCGAGAGCESNLLTSVSHCGACGNACEGSRAAWACESGSCAVVGCDAGFDDCDGDDETGCETDLANDEAHCGACGNVCGAGETCVDGTCDPVVDGAGDELHTCWLRHGGRVLCSGDNEFGQLGGAAPSDRHGIGVAVTWEDGRPFLAKDVQPAGPATCAIAAGGEEDGRVYCWGSGRIAAPGAGITVQTWPRALESSDAAFASRRFTSLSGLFSRVCARSESGELWCWGQVRNVAAFPAGSTVNSELRATRLDLPVAARSLALGYTNLCFVGTDARAYCQGERNGNGNGEPSDRASFAAVEGLEDVAQIDTMRAGACARTTDGRLFCWGGNGYGQLGYGDTATRTRPTLDTPVLEDVVDFATYDRGVCALRSDESVWCWGEQRNGIAASGVLSETNVTRPARIDHPLFRGVTRMLRGPQIGCVARRGGPACWGADVSMATGTSDDGIVTPTAMAATDVVDGQLAFGKGSTGGGCLLHRDGSVSCVGALSQGLAGTAASLRWSSGELVPHPDLRSGVTEVAVGTGFACAIASGEVRCFGSNLQGRLGVSGPSSTAPVTVPLPSGHGARGLALGSSHACVILTGGPSAGEVWCWGENSNGRLGRPSVAVAAPGAIVGLPGPADAVAATQLATYVLVGGRVYALGLTTGGVPTETPTELTLEGGGAFEGVRQIAGGRFHACGIVSATEGAPGSAYCWGDNSLGRLGSPGFSTPFARAVTGSSDAVSIAPGHQHTCVARADGSVVCFGSDRNGERAGLGDGATPAVIAGVTGVTRIRGGSFGTRRVLAIRGDGTAVCWGENVAGACGLGGPTAFASPRPVLGL